jgi:hypothetical protein
LILSRATALAVDPLFWTHLIGREFSPLSEMSVGLLVSDSAATLRAAGRSGPADAVLFSRDADGYRWIYLRSPAANNSGVTVPVPGPAGRGSPVRERFDGFAVATPALLRNLGVTDPFTVVEVEVNAGRGSPAGADRFVATGIRQLDGSSGKFPFSATAAIVRIREMCSERGDFQHQVRQKAAFALAQETGHAFETSEPSLQIHATWNSRAERIDAACVIEVIAAETRVGEGTVASKETPGNSGRPWGLRAVATAGLLFTVSKQGEVRLTGESPITPDIKDIRPPSESSGQR